MFRLSDIKIWIRLTASIWAVLIVAWAGVILWESHANRKAAIEQAQDFSLSMHDSTMAGLTALMIVEKMEKRHVLLDQIKQLAAIRELRVVPSELAIEGVESSKDAGKARNDLKPNGLEERVIKNGQELIQLGEDENEARTTPRPPPQVRSNRLPRALPRWRKAPRKCANGRARACVVRRRAMQVCRGLPRASAWSRPRCAALPIRWASLSPARSPSITLPAR